MAETFTFLPRRTFGIVFHVILIIFILTGCGVMIWQAFQQTGGMLLVIYLLGSIILFILVPLVGYRGYALLHGIYSLKRDGLRIRWGLRAEDIPLSEVKWVRPATDLEIPLNLPAFSMPGALLGMVEHPDLGQVEFIASTARNLIIVATINKVFAVSPELKDEFVQRFQRALEMGTINPMEPCSTIPAAFMRQVALDQYGRALIPIGLGLTLVLLVVVGLSIPAHPTLSIGFDAEGKLLPPVASSRLLLLPVLGILLYILGTVAGIYLYRKVETRSVAWLVWSSSVITPILLISAAVILLFSS
jgi:hypothetical protein